jgi:hypothetical protein
MHHRNEERLIWIYDVHLLASRLDSHTLERFADLAVERGVGAVCRHQLLLAHDRFGTAIPQEVLTRLSTASAEPTARYLSPNRRWRHEFAASLRGLPRWADRARLAREVLLPKPAYMFATYGMASGRGSAALLPALYTHRALSGAWKVVRGRK